MTADLARHIGVIARKILGEPNKNLSTRDELRFGSHGSIAVKISGPNAGEWFDHEQRIGGGPLALLRLKGGLVDEDIPAWLDRELGVRPNCHDRSDNLRIVDTYDYTDEIGNLLFQVCRLHPKAFKQRRPDGKGGWIWNTKGVRRVPYRLPELLAAVAGTNSLPWRAYLVEGEKDADALARWGLTTTTNPGGAGKWHAEYTRYFAGADVVVIGDNDETGRDHARSVAASLAPVTASVRLLDLQGLPGKGDISDWIAAGGTQSDLETMVELTPAFEATEIDLRPPQYSDDALALRFTERHAAELRFVAHWSRWFIWTNGQWRIDETMRAFDLARSVCREASSEVTSQTRSAAQIASAKTVAAVEKLAKSDRRHAASVAQWDTDPWLLLTGGPNERC